MNRTERNKLLHNQLKEERDSLYNTEMTYGNTIEYSFKKVNDRLDEVCDRLDRLSSQLYNIARYDNTRIFDDMMGNPIEQLDELISEVKQ